jgi:hypothetical protein
MGCNESKPAVIETDAAENTERVVETDTNVQNMESTNSARIDTTNSSAPSEPISPSVKEPNTAVDSHSTGTVASSAANDSTDNSAAVEDVSVSNVSTISASTNTNDTADETTTPEETTEKKPVETAVETFKFTAPDGKGFNKKGDYRKYMFATFFSFSNRENEFLCKKSGDIDGQAFNLTRLTNCEVQLLDHSDQILADYLKDCRIFIGPSAGSVFLRNCVNCSITVAAKQLRTRDCKNCRFYVYSKTEPVIEMTEDVEIRRFNGDYEGIDAHFKAANLDRTVDNWDKIHDFSKKDKDLGPLPHYKLIKLVPTAWKANGERTTERPRLMSTTIG